MTIEKIFIQIDNEKIELTGQAKVDFMADRNAKIEAKAQEVAAELAEAEAKAQAKAAAEGKLAALGLTTDDLRALGL